MEIERLRLQYEITKAQLLYEITPAKLNISVKHGQMDIKHEPLKLTIDNQGFFDSVGIKADTPQAREQAQKGKAAIDAAGRYTREKSVSLNPTTMNPSEIAAVQAVESSSGARAASPAEKPRMTWTGGKVSIKAERDQINVDWQLQSVDFKYIPYAVEFYIDKW
jgi:hypothetical protein